MFIVGTMVGYRSALDFVGLAYLMLAGWCVFLAFSNNFNDLFALIPYLIYTELFVRAYVPFVPYLFMPYLYITLAFILLTQNSSEWKMFSRSFIFIVLFVIVEFINSFRSTEPDIARGLLVNSIAIMAVSVWGAFNRIDPVLANRILKNVKYASVYLCGMVIVRYLKGDVEFGMHSGSEGTNGLAPVQISGYLGFSCVVFFFSIMDEKERKHLFLNIFCIAMCAAVMMLSFSRGGVYFIGAIMTIYFVFNSARIKSYFILLLLLPVSLAVYEYISDTTDGLIRLRYEQEGTSGRDELAEAGWKIFLQDPIAGVGPANFNNEIIKRDLYDVKSGAHNEFIRVAAEDGILGVITYWGFFIILIIEILKRKKIQREFALYFVVLFSLIAIHNGLKISIQPLLILLAVSTHSMTKVKRKKLVLSQPKLANQPA